MLWYYTVLRGVIQVTVRCALRGYCCLCGDYIDNAYYIALYNRGGGYMPMELYSAM